MLYTQVYSFHSLKYGFYIPRVFKFVALSLRNTIRFGINIVNVYYLSVTDQNILVSYCGCSMFHQAGRWLMSAPYWTVCTHHYKNRKLLFRQSSQLLKRRHLQEPWVPRMRQLGEDQYTLVQITTNKQRSPNVPLRLSGLQV